MPDPSVSDALAEAYATAPAEEVQLDTLELRHPAFVDANGNPDSIWVVVNTEDIAAPIEADAPIRGGETAPFIGMPFHMTRPQVESGATPEIELALDNVDRRIADNLDLAASGSDKVLAIYRPYLATDLEAGPQMVPPPEFELRDVKVDVLRATARARTTVDLQGAFPIRLYTAREFPGLVDR